MTPERFQRLDEIFQRAVELPPVSRQEYLDAACGEDVEMRAEVEALLAEEGGTGVFDQSAMSRAGTMLEDLAPEPETPSEPEELRAGDIVGAYRVQEEVGRGGMGVVYRASRADGTYDQEVAIKVTRRSIATPSVVDRFRRERRILGLLDHPNIARILDGGTLSGGRPYYVMEFVGGKTIVDYCVRQKLPLRERLRLFLQVCAALSHAHQNLIIHRDLKPANIMVTEAGQVKLLDFGIAKIFQPEFDDPAQTRVAAGMMLTPDYASPEQVRGEAVTTGTDVYALGLILHELLTGQRAQRVTSSSMLEVERVVCGTSPARPSDSANEGSGIAPARLRGDIDNIVLKAVQKDPARRYPTVNQFAEDIERHLQGLPVVARPDAFFYRFGKFVGRNKLAVTAATAVVTSLAIGIGVATWQARIARSHFDSVRGLAKALMTDVEPTLATIPGTTKARHLLVKHTLEYLDKIAGRGGSPDLMIELADTYQAVANLQGNRNRANLGDYQGAMASYRKALELRRQVQRREPSRRNRERMSQLAARAARVFPRSDEALQLANLALELTNGLESEFPGKYGAGHANSYFGIGYVHLLRDELDKSIEAMKSSRSWNEKANGRNNFAVCDRYFGLALRRLGKPAEALPYLYRALEVDREDTKGHRYPRLVMNLSFDHEMLARALSALGRVPEAAAEAARTRELRDELLKVDRDDRQLADAMVDLDEIQGILDIRSGRRKSGLERLERAIEGSRKRLSDTGGNEQDEYDLGLTYLGAAEGFAWAGECARSAATAAEARSIFVKLGANTTVKRLDRLPKCVSR